MNMMSRFFSQSFQSNRFQLTRFKAVSAKRRVLMGFAVIVSALTACSLVEERDYPVSDHYDGSHFYNRDEEGNSWPAFLIFSLPVFGRKQIGLRREQTLKLNPFQRASLRGFAQPTSIMQPF